MQTINQLVSNCQKGNSEEFGGLYEMYFGKIYRFVYYKTMCKQVAEDLVSTTFLKAFENIGQFDSNKGSFSAWIYRIARNNVIDYYRAKKHDIDISDIWDLKAGENIEVDVENQEKIDELKESIRELKPEQREILMLRIWDNLPYSEIADITGKTEENCRVIFSRTIRGLRKNIILCLFALSLTF